MLDASEGYLFLFRLDASGAELTLGLSETCRGYDVDAMCSLLTWGGVNADDAIDQVDEFARWWNTTDVVEMVENGAESELRYALKPFDDANVFYVVEGLQFELD